MTYLLCRNRVADYGQWRSVFDSHAAAHVEAGLLLVHVWRGVDEPADVFYLFEVTDEGKARAFIRDPDAAKAGELAGVVEGEFHFVEGAERY